VSRGVSPTDSRRATIAAVALAAGALGFGAWRYLDSRREAPPEIHGYVLATPRALPAFELVDEHGRPFRPADFVGRWSFLYFGYTYCPVVCPLTLVELAKLEQRLSAELPAERVDYYLVSVDPRRDSPARLREYVAYFDPSFHGLTGSPDALAAFARATDSLFDVPEHPEADNYLVGHSSNLVLLDPRGDVHAVLSPPHDPAALAADFTKLAARFAATR
jgi:protein SCO1/2